MVKGSAGAKTQKSKTVVAMKKEDVPKDSMESMLGGSCVVMRKVRRIHTFLQLRKLQKHSDTILVLVPAVHKMMSGVPQALHHSVVPNINQTGRMDFATGWLKKMLGTV